ncbi:MAG: hypothetical protein J5599_00275 [Spirochaetales bacterium]|nr:hypothetical protein [Spirochaetales bacterium]
MKIKTIRSTAPDASLVVLNTFEGEGALVFDLVGSMTDADFSILEVSGMDWNRDLSPWEAPAVFKNDAPFGGKADDYLHELTEKVIPAAVSEMGSKPKSVFIAGYSLAGLFAVYSLYKTSVFSGAASASGSFWFPGFLEFVSSHELASKPSKVYLSLGDREAKTRNSVMSMVQDNTERLVNLYKAKGIDVVYELNSGNHFQDPAKRMAKGIARLLS